MQNSMDIRIETQPKRKSIKIKEIKIDYRLKDFVKPFLFATLLLKITPGS